MRIRSWPAYIHEKETTEHFMKNCPLVVDGTNFFYNSYQMSGLPFKHGSEADEHAKYIMRCKLQLFKDAGITCYFIFKGGDSDMTHKFHQLEKKKMIREGISDFISPVFAREVCLQLLQEMGMKYTTSVTESKNDCVALALALNCPVLGLDIEFAFKYAPYVPYFTTKLRRPDKYLKCKQFNLQRFLSKYSLTLRKYAIFSVLLDSNIYPINHFGSLFKTWGVYNDDRYALHKYLIEWISLHSEDEVLSNVSEFLSCEDEFKRFFCQVKSIEESVRGRTSVATEYLSNGCQLSTCRRDPLWFAKGVAAQHIAIPYIDLYKHKCIRSDRRIEDKESEGCLMLSIDIIKYAYNLLTNFQFAQICIFDAECRINIDSEDGNVRKPMYQCEESVFEDGWSNIQQLKLFEHFLKEKDIVTDSVSRCPEDSRLLIISLVYFAQKKMSEGVDVTHIVYCLVISYVMLNYVLENRFNKYVKIYDVAEAIAITGKYFRNRDFGTRHKDNNNVGEEEDTNTTLRQLQICLLHMNNLNTLCGKQYDTLKYHRTFNGTFIYRLLEDMKDCNASEFVENLFRNAPSVLEIITVLVATFKEMLW